MSFDPVPRAQSVITPNSRRHSAPAATSTRGSARSELAELQEALRSINKGAGTRQSGRLREALQVIRTSGSQGELPQLPSRAPEAAAEASQLPTRNFRWSCPTLAPRVAEAIQSLNSASSSPALASKPKNTCEWARLQETVQPSRARWSTPEVQRSCVDGDPATPRSSTGSTRSGNTSASEAFDSPLSQADVPLNFKGEPPLAKLCAQTFQTQTTQLEVDPTPLQMSEDPRHDQIQAEAESSVTSGSDPEQNHQEVDASPSQISKDPMCDRIQAEVDSNPLQMSKAPGHDRMQTEAASSFVSDSVQQRNHHQVDPAPLHISTDPRHDQIQSKVESSLASVSAQQQNLAFLVPIGAHTQHGQANKHEDDLNLFGLCFIGFLHCLVGIQLSAEAVFEAAFKNAPESA